MEKVFGAFHLTYAQVVLILGKLGTVLVDRRFLAAVGTVLFMVFGIPEGKYTEEITQIGTLIMSLVTVLSWTYRPPSGLKHKELVELGAILKAVGVINTTYEQK
jgi:hypothetical protein